MEKCEVVTSGLVVRRSVIPCSSGKPIVEYFNEPRIRKQLNIPVETSHIWDFCNEKLNQAY